MMTTEQREAEISQLCQSCGACCDGTMYTRVQVEPEMPLASRRRLQLLDDQAWLELPCKHLTGTRCGVYADRPLKCRTYLCKQVDEHRADGGSIDQRLALVQAIRVLSRRVRAAAVAGGASPQTTHWGLFAAMERGDGSVPPELALDVIELTVRIRRDLGWISDEEAEAGKKDADAS